MQEAKTFLEDQVQLEDVGGLLDGYFGLPDNCRLWQGFGLLLKGINRIYNGTKYDPVCMYKI